MFKRLQRKWGVSTRRFWIIFLAFALTGTTAAYLTRYLTHWLGMDANTYWAWKLLLRLGMLLIGYQILLLFYGSLLGEWKFFWKYERKLLIWMKVLKDKSGVWSLESGVENKSRLRREGVEDERKSRLFIHNSFNQKQPQTTDHRLQTTPLLQTPNSRLQTQIALFASGTGTNAEKIIDHLRDHPSITVALVVCNKPGAGVLQVAERNGIPVLLIEKERFFRGDAYLAELAAYGIDFIVLAGFLWKIPESLIRAFPRRIVNIHPALLPKYGGKGMYGSKVHEAVLAAGEKQTGITIHYVNEHFDEGEHIFQASCDLAETDTAEDIARKVHALEHEHFPQVVERLVMEAVNQG